MSKNKIKINIDKFWYTNIIQQLLAHTSLYSITIYQLLSWVCERECTTLHVYTSENTLSLRRFPTIATNCDPAPEEPNIYMDTRYTELVKPIQSSATNMIAFCSTESFGPDSNIHSYSSYCSPLLENSRHNNVTLVY